QGDHSLEDHTMDFVFLANLTHYLDSCLCPWNVLERASPPMWSGCPTPDPVPNPTSPRRCESRLHRLQGRNLQWSMRMQRKAPPTAPVLRVSKYWNWDLINFDEDIYADMPPLIPPSSKLSVDPESSVCPDLSACLDFPPTLPLLPHPLIPASATPPLSPDSPTAHLQPTIFAVGSLRVCQFPSALRLEDPWTPPRPSNPAAPPRLLAPAANPP
ncbi:hypothetical protein M9458_017378, partial [Cirrhinus mrigala]